MVALFFTMWALCFNFSTAFVTHDQRHVQPPLGVAEVRVEHDNGNSKGVFMLALAIASALIGGLLLFLCCLWLFKLQRLKNSTRNGEHHLDDGAKERPLVPIFGKLNSLRMGGKKGNISLIEYHVLEQATGNFEESNKIGEGNQGVVYRACLGESFAAVKKFNNDRTHQKFQNEVVWLSKLHHQNIITLLGYSIRGESRLVVYEMMQNGSLEFQLHGPSSGSGLTWSLRMKIALDVARGLEYLHERCEPAVLHGDLKSSNILLDSKFNAKISGFSHAISVGKSNNDFKASETSSYSAPEYLLDGKPTDKVDVYAFGVVLLELLTGRQPVEKMSRERHRSIVTWAMPQLTDRSKLPNIVDPVIRDKMDRKHLYQVAAVAVLCVQSEPSYRPLITDVLHSLIPLVPVDLGGSLRAAETSSTNS